MPREALPPFRNNFSLPFQEVGLSARERMEAQLHYIRTLQEPPDSTSRTEN